MGPAPGAPGPRHLGADHLVAAAGELGVPIAEQQPPPPAVVPSTPSRFRAGWGTPPPSGLAVTPARWTRRLSSSMKHRTSSRPSPTIATGNQVAGEDPSGLVAQQRPPGAGGSLGCRGAPMAAMRDTDRGRRDPNPEVRQFALAGQVAPGGVLAGQVDNPAVGFPGPAVAGPSGGAGRSRRRRTMRRCQPSSVSGCTNKHDQRELGSTQLTGPSSARSGGSSLRRGSWRRRTVRWWPSTRSSRSVAPSPRATRLSSWMERHSVREARFDTTRDGLPRIDTGRSRPSCRPTRISRSQAAFEYPYPSRSCCNPHATSATKTASTRRR